MPKKKPSTGKIIPIRLNHAEIAAIDKEISDVKKTSGLSITHGLYAKHAVLEHRRLRAMEVILQASVQSTAHRLVREFALAVLAEPGR